MTGVSHIFVQEQGVEIGDIIDIQEEPKESSRRSRRERPVAESAKGTEASPTSPRRKTAATQQRGRGRNGNGSAAGALDLGELLDALKDLRDGDFSVRLPGSADPVIDDIAGAFNGIAERNERLASEAVRVSTTIGREGQMHERASIGRATGGWATITSSINALITDLVS
ncbi:MAG: hypothetical protein ABIR58_02715, partial [Gemmatimonadaceae bacterium]